SAVPDQTPAATPDQETPPMQEPGEAGDSAQVEAQPEAAAPDEAAGADVDDEAMFEMLKNLPEQDSNVSADDIGREATRVGQAEFQQLTQPSVRTQANNLDLLMDINLPVSIELGRTRMPLNDILALGPGSVVELNKLAGEPVDVMVNQKQVARGEVVVIDEYFGVRITQLMTPEERLKLLGEEQ
ncbi:MAG: flagellar motor switch protein FliN, partial [Candidatus Zixiibacteriota bacterium]